MFYEPIFIKSRLLSVFRAPSTFGIPIHCVSLVMVVRKVADPESNYSRLYSMLLFLYVYVRQTYNSQLEKYYPQPCYIKKNLQNNEKTSEL